MSNFNISSVLGQFLDCSFKVDSTYCGLQQIHKISCFNVRKYGEVNVRIIGDKFNISQNGTGYCGDDFCNMLFLAISDSISIET